MDAVASIPLGWRQYVTPPHVTVVKPSLGHASDASMSSRRRSRLGIALSGKPGRYRGNDQGRGVGQALTGYGTADTATIKMELMGLRISGTFEVDEDSSVIGAKDITYPPFLSRLKLP